MNETSKVPFGVFNFCDTSFFDFTDTMTSVVDMSKKFSRIEKTICQILFSKIKF